MNETATSVLQSAERRRRPVMVTAIAVFEIAAACLILLVMVCQWCGRGFDPAPKSLTQVITLNAVYFYVPCDETTGWPLRNAGLHPFCPVDPAEQRTEEILETAFSLPIAGWTAYLGLGLLYTKRSARGCAIAWSGLTVLIWLRGLLIAWGFGDLGKHVLSSQTRTNAVAGLVLNAFIVLYLLYGNGVADAFGEKE